MSDLPGIFEQLWEVGTIATYSLRFSVDMNYIICVVFVAHPTC